MWPARAAETPVSTGALGSLRERTQSKKFSMWEMVPSRKLSALMTGLRLPGTPSRQTVKPLRLIFRVASVPRNSRPPSSMEEVIVPS